MSERLLASITAGLATGARVAARPPGYCATPRGSVVYHPETRCVPAIAYPVPRLTTRVLSVDTRPTEPHDPFAAPLAAFLGRHLLSEPVYGLLKATEAVSIPRLPYRPEKALRLDPRRRVARPHARTTNAADSPSFISTRTLLSVVVL